MREPGAGNHLARLAHLAISLSYRTDVTCHFGDFTSRDRDYRKSYRSAAPEMTLRGFRPCGAFFCIWTFFLT